MKVAFVGFTTKVCDNPECFLPTPVAPSNYKDKERIDEYIQKARSSQLERAKDILLTGRLDDVYILLQNGEALKIDPTKPVLEPLHDFNVLVGYRIFDFLDFGIKDAAEKLGRVPANCQWMKVSRNNKYPYLDPGSVQRKVIFDPIDTLGGAEAMADPLLLAKYYSWDIQELKKATDFAKLAAIAGRYFFKV